MSPSRVYVVEFRAPFFCHRRFPLAAFLAGLSLLALPTLRGDTVFLKDGTQILDCKVTSETDTYVSLRTTVGDMMVPKGEVFRIQRVKTPYDLYKEQLSTIRKDDAIGMFKLAGWCRGRDLRKESDELLSRVIALNENHAAARRMLGHLKIGGEWIVPTPLSIRLKANGPSAGDLRTTLGLFLETRRDVLLESESDSGAGAGDPLDHCVLEAALFITRSAPIIFYGQAIGGPSIRSTVRLEAKSPWIGKTSLKTAAEGQVPSSAGGPNVAVQNAIGSNSAVLHRFLDQVAELRLKKLEEGLRKKAAERKETEKKVAESTGPES